MGQTLFGQLVLIMFCLINVTRTCQYYFEKNDEVLICMYKYTVVDQIKGFVKILISISICRSAPGSFISDRCNDTNNLF